MIAFLESLAGAPHRAGEYSAKDGAGRTVELTVFGRHVVTYYADHAVRELRVLDMQAAD